MDFDKAYVITGSIATGKSAVCKILSERGYEVIDADKIAHKLLDDNSADIAEMFGSDMLTVGRRIDRKALGAVVFSDKLARQKLERLMHPKIKHEIMRMASELNSGDKVFFIDIPLFFETKNYDFSNTVLVYATREIQLGRLMNRDSLNEEAAKSKISLQIDIEEKKEMSKYIIDNSFGHDALVSEIDKFLMRIKDDATKILC